MDAHAHLLSLGWAGPGHALDSRPYKQKGHRGLAYDPNASTNSENTGNGLVKPLLISQRKSRFGIGKKAHEPASGNEWWLKGFQNALQNVGKSESERSSGASTPVHNPGFSGKHGGLYGYFIKGQMMKGTIEEDERRRGKKRKSDVLEDNSEPTLDLLAVKPVTKEKSARDFEDAVSFMTERDRERKSKHKINASTDAEQFSQIGQFFNVAQSEKPNRKDQTSGLRSYETSGTTTPREETKDERRERRRKKREGKSKSENLSLAQMVEEELAKLRSQSDGEEDDSMLAIRRAERKKAKSEKATRGISIKA